METQEFLKAAEHMKTEEVVRPVEKFKEGSFYMIIGKPGAWECVGVSDLFVLFENVRTKKRTLYGLQEISL